MHVLHCNRSSYVLCEQREDDSSNQNVYEATAVIIEESSDASCPLNEDTLINGVPWRKLKFSFDDDNFDLDQFTVRFYF